MPALKGAADKITKETQSVFNSKAHLFDGHVRTYQAMAEGGDAMPDDRSPLGTTVGEKIAHFVEMLTPALDGTFQVERTNQRAVATLTVDDLVVENVPATFLMQLDSRLSAIRGVIDAIPTRDPKYEWVEAPEEGKGVWKTRFDEKTNRTVDKLVPVVLYEATKEHPAQVKEASEQRKVGEYTTKRLTGRLSPAQKYELLSRVDKLQRAVKTALSEANDVEHSTEKIAAQLFDYVVGDLPLSR
jgi:hypothetical protein